MQRISLMLLAIMAMAQCNQDAELLLNGVTKLTSKMFSEVVSVSPNSSFVLSAFSVCTPLGLLALGAEGKSKDELLTAIGLPNEQSTKSAFSNLNTKLESLKGMELTMVNRIYVSKKFSLNKDYAAMSRLAFKSDITSADFSQAVETAAEINSWVENQTHHRIKDLVDPKDLSPLVKVMLVNSVYFQSEWRSPFSKALTTDKDFHVSRHKKVKVPMMRRNSYYRYGQSVELDSTIVEIRYVGNNSGLYIILPNDLEGINVLNDKLKDTSVLEKELQKLTFANVDLEIPKFTIETKIDLKRILPNVGVKKIFTDEANLTKVISGQGESFFVVQATQKAFIEVNEKGTAAGAANEFKEFPTASYNTKSFVADRPFVFDLRIDNTPLFRGIYTAT